MATGREETPRNTLSYLAFWSCLTGSLTTSVDLGTSFTGTASADTFYGSIIGDLATGTTLNPGDNLVGNGGNDALNITLSGDPTTASTYIIQTATIETINLGNYDTATGTDATFNLASASGLTNLNVTGGDGDTVATGLTAAVVLGSSSATGNLSVTYASGVLSGTADTQSVTLTNFGLEADSPTLTIADASGAAAIAETLAVTSSGTANYLTIAASNNHTKLTVTGSGALTVDGNADTTLKTIDASASTGGVSITNIGASNLTMTGGSGSDLLRIDGSTINTSDTINAGDGTDTLELTVAANVTSATNGAKLVGFETINAYRNETFADTAAVTTVVAQDVSLLGTSPTTVGVSSFSLAQNAGAGNGTDETVVYGANFTNLGATTAMALSGFSVTDASTGTADDGFIATFTATADLATDTVADSIAVTLL